MNKSFLAIFLIAFAFSSAMAQNITTPVDVSDNGTIQYANVSNWTWLELDPVNVTSNQRILDMFSNGSIAVVEKTLVQQNVSDWDFDADLYNTERYNLSSRVAFFRYTAQLVNSDNITINTKFIMRLNRTNGESTLFSYESIINVPEINFNKTELLDNNPDTEWAGAEWNTEDSVEIDIGIESENDQEWDNFEFNFVNNNQESVEVQFINDFENWSLQWEDKEPI